MKLNNPFVVTGYRGKEYFCDRVEETARLSLAIRNESNVTLLAPRRYGKTGLIHHLFGELSARHGYKTIYIDIFGTKTLKDFVELLAKSIIGKLDTPLEMAQGAAKRLLHAVRPTLSYDGQTGQPTMSITLSKDAVPATLEQIFAYLKDREQPVVIAIDEFQQVREYPEQDVEALLRTYIQDSPAQFIFSGSKHHVLRDIFLSPKKPFYQSTLMYPLNVIAEDPYYDFANRFFTSAGLALKREVFHRLYEKYEGVTWYLQTILWHLYAVREDVTAWEQVEAVIEERIAANEYEGQQIIELLPEGSQRLLKAIAKEGCVTAPQSGDFIAKYSLRAASSVKTSLESLIDKEIVYPSGKGYTVYDRFLADYLARK